MQLRIAGTQNEYPIRKAWGFLFGGTCAIFVRRIRVTMQGMGGGGGTLLAREIARANRWNTAAFLQRNFLGLSRQPFPSSSRLMFPAEIISAEFVEHRVIPKGSVKCFGWQQPLPLKGGISEKSMQTSGVPLGGWWIDFQPTPYTFFALSSRLSPK